MMVDSLALRTLLSSFCNVADNEIGLKSPQFSVGGSVLGMLVISVTCHVCGVYPVTNTIFSSCWIVDSIGVGGWLVTGCILQHVF